MNLRILSATLVLSLTVTAGAATFTSGRPTSTDNDDTCDIALLPAATLLLPYFDVDLTTRAGDQTLMTITNVGNKEQVARITLWTDRGFPVITFNVYLTGYDVQSLNLYDVVGLGQIAPTSGTGFEDPGSPEGDYSIDNFRVARETCRSLPMQLHPTLIERMQQAFTLGRTPGVGSVPACPDIGGVHTNAVGYATVDVVNTCAATQPTDSGYFTREISFDNVLTGDYQQVNSSQNFAQGSPMVHIRAIPETDVVGPTLAPPEPTNLPNTFYGRFQSATEPGADARQPLPATFAAHWIQGGPGELETFLKIWREVPTGPAAACDAYKQNGEIGVAEVVRFDEEENLTVLPDSLCCFLPYDTRLPAASLASVADDDIFPPKFGTESAGWIYLNLDDPQRAGASQAWVVSSMRAEGRFSVDADVVALGNGCTPALVGQSEVNAAPSYPIGPAPDVNP